MVWRIFYHKHDLDHGMGTAITYEHAKERAEVIRKHGYKTVIVEDQGDHEVIDIPGTFPWIKKPLSYGCTEEETEGWERHLKQ